MNRIRSFFACFIPQYVSAGAILSFLKIFSFPIPRRIREKHLEKNEEAWREAVRDAVSDSYIERQSALAGLVLGRKNASYNACEVIAAYNACVAQNQPVSFPEMIAEFEKMGLVFLGAFGTSPDRLLRYFQRLGWRAKLLRGKEIDRESAFGLEEQCDVFLLTAFNDRRDILAQVHTVCVTKEERGFRIHNGTPSVCFSSTLFESVTGFNGGRGKAIALIGLRFKKGEG